MKLWQKATIIGAAVAVLVADLGLYVVEKISLAARKAS
jgi:hypothetical protein